MAKLNPVLIEIRDCYACNTTYHLIATETCPEGHETHLLDTLKAYVSP